jgi:hypothetical protein
LLECPHWKWGAYDGREEKFWCVHTVYTMPLWWPLHHYVDSSHGLNISRSRASGFEIIQPHLRNHPCQQFDALHNPAVINLLSFSSMYIDNHSVQERLQVCKLSTWKFPSDTSFQRPPSSGSYPPKW